MKYIRSWAVAATAVAVLTACGGGGDGDQTPRVRYSKMISFGDSLSDVGTYKVSTIAAVGGGTYSINGTANSNWTQRVALAAGVASGCAAQTGLNSVIPDIPAVTATNVADCFNYAQGGARVTNPVGPSNLATYPADPGGALGQLTVPVVTQINNHLAKTGGTFAADELVTVMAGGNDVFMNLAAVGQGLPPDQAVVAMATAGAQLAGYVKALIVEKGATHVVVVNLPDVSQTPFALAQSADTQGLINAMVTNFNAQLSAGLTGTSEVLLVDAYTQGRAQTAAPAQYGVTNITTPACDLTVTILPSSLVCTSSTLVAGDVSHYQYADTVHPTPYGYQLLAQYVTQRMTEAGWL
jgi:outer membrane lipase/esterase